MKLFTERDARRAYSATACALAVSALYILPVLAQSTSAGDISGVATQLTKNLQSLVKLIGVGAFVIGSGFGVMGAIGLKKHADNPMQNSLKQPLVQIAVAGLLIGLPILLSTTIASIFGGSGSLTGDLTSLGSGSLGKN